MGVAVLRLEAGVLRVVEDRAQLLDLAARQAELLVHDDAGDGLLSALTLHAALLHVEREAFVFDDVTDLRDEASDVAALSGWCAEREIVGVARVRPAGFVAEAFHAAIE